MTFIVLFIHRSDGPQTKIHVVGKDELFAMISVRQHLNGDKSRDRQNGGAHKEGQSVMYTSNSFPKSLPDLANLFRLKELII